MILIFCWTSPGVNSSKGDSSVKKYRAREFSSMAIVDCRFLCSIENLILYQVSFLKGTCFILSCSTPFSFCREVPPWENYLIQFHTPIIYHEKRATYQLQGQIFLVKQQDLELLGMGFLQSQCPRSQITWRPFCMFMPGV